MAKIHIIGAGPCGSITAISAIRSGHAVIVSEEHHEAGRHTTCSGLFSAQGMKSLEDYIDHHRSIINLIHGADIHFSNEKFSVRTKNPVAVVCDRADFDSRLASHAESEGAKMNFGERVARDFRSENIIGADGPNSFVARHFGFPPIKKYVCAVKAIVKHKAEDHSVLSMYLSKDKFPGFFGWVIPHSEDTAEFGAGVLLPGSVRDAWKHLLKMHEIDEIGVKLSADIIPMVARKQTSMSIGKHSVLLVGDAAGQTKSTTGGGVIFGGNCAAIAGKHATNPTRYEIGWRSRFGADMFLHGKIRAYLDSLNDQKLAALGKKINELELATYLSKHGNMDRPLKMVKPGLFFHVAKAMVGMK